MDNSGDSTQNGQAVPDAIFRRMNLGFAFCEDCKMELKKDPESIDLHFHPGHPAKVNCGYCHGKVFHYTYQVGDLEVKVETYHRCFYIETK